jgi:hypothetical protein
MESWNYFNYFTEIEEHFWKKRGAHLLVSPLDWAVMETWQKAGVSLEAALKGIDRAFESYQRSRRVAGKPLKSLAYCTDAVLDAAEESKEAAAGGQSNGNNAKAKAEPFPREELKKYFERNREMLKKAAERQAAAQPEVSRFLKGIGESLGWVFTLLEAPGSLDVEDLERRLTILDEKVHAALLTHAREELMLKIRREVDSQLAVYRRKMKVEQLALVEKKYLQKRLLDEYQLPRLSLYYFS